MKPPAFQFYADDFLSGTMNLTNAEVGLYVRLLCVQWTKGCLSSSPLVLLSYGKGRTQLSRILDKFSVGADGNLRNERLEKERVKQAEWREKCANAGRLSGKVRGKVSSRLVQGEGELNANSPLSTLQLPLKTLLGADAPPVAKPQKRVRDRSPLLDALAACDGSDPLQVTHSAWGAIGKALSEIKQVSPDVTPEEITRRAKNYARAMRDATISASALAKHWARCDRVKGQPQEKPVEFIAECPAWKSLLNHERPNSIYSANGSNEAHNWDDLSSDVKRLCWQLHRETGSN